ncbi:MAG: hypothetical protein ACR2NI_09730 [Pirellulales bacterium]
MPPFDPDELANGLIRWLEHGRKPKPEPKDAKPLPESEYGFVKPGSSLKPEPSPPPAEMPGSGPSIQELQEQIKALQEQLKAIEGDGGAQFVPHLRGPELTPDEQRKRDWEMFDKWQQGSGGEPRFARPRKPDIDPGFHFRPRRPGAGERIGPDDAFRYPQPVPMPTYPRNDRPYLPHPDDDDIEADMPSWGPYGQPGAEYDKRYGPQEKPIWETLPYRHKEPMEKPHWENLPYRHKEPAGGQPYELLNGTGSPVGGLNLKVGRHGNNYSPSTVTPGKGASLN